MVKCDYKKEIICKKKTTCKIGCVGFRLGKRNPIWINAKKKSDHQNL